MEDFGLSKISDSTTVTTSDSGLVLGAKENNASVPGTLANEIKETKDTLSKIGAIVQGTKFENIVFPVGDVTKIIGNIILEPGTWIIFALDWNPLPTGALIQIANSLTECNVHSFFLASVVVVNEQTTFELSGRKFGTDSVIATSNYTFFALRIK